MLIESEGYQAKELPQIQASKIILASLQKSTGKEEQRSKNLPKLGRRRWNGGERTEGDPISQQCHGEKQRRRRRRGCRTSSSVGAGVKRGDDGGAPSLFLGPVVKCKRQGSRGGRRWCGVKRRSLPPPPYLYIAREGRGDRGKCSTTPTISAGGRHVAAQSGAAVPVTVPLGNDGLQ
jgi:hypothetical protein